MGRDEVSRVLSDARVEPPIARGDLARLREEGATCFLIIDGAFGHQLAVAPSEIVAALRGGARIVGAASMGAIRAAECAPAGTEGVGAVHALYRLRVISSDDEVAVATNPEAAFEAMSVALINVRYAVLAGLGQRLLDRAAAQSVLTAAKQLHFSERLWRTIFDTAGIRPSAALSKLCREIDIKRRDAERALVYVRSGRTDNRPVTTLAGAREVRAAERYVGHDPLLGFRRAAVQDDLARWLLGTGRYRRYLPADRSLVLDRRLAPGLWSELERCGALESELMRWYAVKRGAALDDDDVDASLGEARQSVASEHGYHDWSALLEQGSCGAVNGIPFAWIEEASGLIAHARQNLRGVTRTAAGTCHPSGRLAPRA